MCPGPARLACPRPSFLRVTTPGITVSLQNGNGRFPRECLWVPPSARPASALSVGWGVKGRSPRGWEVAGRTMATWRVREACDCLLARRGLASWGIARPTAMIVADMCPASPSSPPPGQKLWMCLAYAIASYSSPQGLRDFSKFQELGAEA